MPSRFHLRRSRVSLLTRCVLASSSIMLALIWLVLICLVVVIAMRKDRPGATMSRIAMLATGPRTFAYLSVYSGVVNFGACEMRASVVPNDVVKGTCYLSVFDWSALSRGGRSRRYLLRPFVGASREEIHDSSGIFGLGRIRDGKPVLKLSIISLKWPLFAIFVLIGLAVCTIPWTPFLRRWQRKRRGCCIHCGYDMFRNSSGICPECGEPCTPKKLNASVA